MRRIGFLTGMLIVSFMYAQAYTSHCSFILKDWNLVLPPDTIPHDTLKTNSLPPDSSKNDTVLNKVKVSSDSLDAPVKYHADQKTWMDVTNKRVYLIGNAKVEYKDITLKADSIVFDWSNNQVIAIGRPDTSGKVIGQPVFSQGAQDYKAERIAYNFKTKKGKITDITTEEGGGYIGSETVKRLSNEVMFGKNNTYTTCDREHPHFYIATNKIKVIPNKAIVTGPANLVVADVRTPLIVPFGIFPISNTRKSGIIVPTYGERQDLGFYLERGGYYFGISDHFDLALTGSIYSKGSWLLNTASRFIKKYKFSGGFNIQYANTRVFDAETNTYSPSTQFKVAINYAQDAKANPNSTLTATVSFGTSGFNKVFGDPTSTYVDNIYNSSIAYHKTIPNTPLNFTISASHQQSTLTHIINLQLPVFSLSMNQVYPFKRKLQVGKLQWYEKIGLTYTMNATNQTSAIDSTLFTQNTVNRSLAGVKQTIPISAPFQLFKFVTISPSFNYDETWSLQQFRKSWDPALNELNTDTLQSFISGRDYNLSVGASTRLYGILQFKKGKIKAIRHVFNPSIGYTFRPDFSKPNYGYYYTVQTDSLGHTQQYSIFQGAVYPGPPAGEFDGLSFSLGNNLEMKVASRTDTVSGTKKIKLLDALNLSGAYNFAADSFNLSTFNLNGRTTLFDKIGINFTSIFDPYWADSEGTRRSIYLWDAEHKLVRLTGTSVSVNANFQSPKTTTSQKLTQEQQDYILLSGNQYANFNVPWTFGFGYNLYIRKANTALGADTTTITQTLSLTGSFNLTENWRVSGQTSYDFVQMKFPTAYIQITRDLHCWEMSMSWIPFGSRQSYQFTLRAKAGVLENLKLHKSSDWYSY